MIIVAVIVGYLLGILPFLCPKIYEIMQIRSYKASIPEITPDIQDEWLNGTKKANTPKETFNEYISGSEE